MGEIRNFVPSFHKIKTKYYSKVRAKFPRQDPDDIKMEDIKKYKPKFAEKITLHIMQIEKGSLTITWYILADETYQAYLLALGIPQEFREDDFLQIGMWLTHRPEVVIQELKKVYSELCNMLSKNSLGL